MNYIYKTPQIKNFIEFLITQFPSHKSAIEHFIPKLVSIDLSKHIDMGETFMLNIELSNGDSIPLIWSIDPLISYLSKSNIPVYKKSPSDLLKCKKLNFNTPEYCLLMNSVKQNKQNVYCHKTDYIIISELPFFSGNAIIDGNHRFCHALITNTPTINCCLIPPEISLLFLQPESQTFLKIMIDIKNLLW